MAFSAKVGSFVTGTGAAATSVAVTGVGFTPSFVLFWWVGRTDTTDAVGGATHRRGYGAMSATEQIYLTSRSADGAAAATVDDGWATDACVAVLDSTGAIDGALAFSAFGADGFTLTVTNAMPDSMRVHFLAMGGTDLTNIDFGTLTEPAATGTQDTTSVGFQPDCVLFLYNRAEPPPTVAIDSTMMFGAAAGATPANYVWAGGSNDASDPTQTVSYCLSGECIGRINGTATAMAARAAVTAWLSNGFTLNWIARNTTGTTYAYIALKGPRFVLGDLLTQTDTTTDIAETGLGLSPSAVLFVSHCKTASTAGTVQDDDDWSMGAFSDASTERAAAMTDDDAQATTIVATAVEHDNVYIKVASDALESSMQCISVDTDGFTCEMTDAAAAQAFVWYLAVARAALATTTTCAQGSYTYTGQDVTLRLAGTLAIGQGSYTYTGQSMTPKLATTMALAQGSYVYTGQDVTLRLAGTLAIGQGSYALTGQDIGLRLATTLALGQGSYALTGQDVGLRLASTMSLGQGSYALTGQSVGLTLASVMSCATGFYALTFQQFTEHTEEGQAWLEPTPEYRRGLALEMLRRRQH